MVSVEPNNYLRRLALDRAGAVSVPIRVVAGVAESFPSDDGTFDAVVASLVLCSVREQAVVLAELRRVLRPGGELRCYEHVIDESRSGARVQRSVDLVWPALFGGCHTDRDTVAAMVRSGFELQSWE
ncbi:MAG: class I SAM-dependent methyltransferase [Acidimicrobiales bacterium]